MKLRSWLPEHLQKLTPYQPGKPIGEVQRELGLNRVIKLASNENSYGPSPRALDAARAALDAANLYPEGGAFYLRQALCEYHRIREDQIAFGAGSTELIQLLVAGFLEPKDHALVADVTFLMFRLSLDVHRISYTSVPMKNHAYDLERFLHEIKPKTRMVYIANPNNPTGTYIPRNTLQEFLSRLPEDILVLYDEAYCHYVTREDYPAGLDLFRDDPRIVVLRTFSKAYGLANLRIGYAIANPEIIRGLNIVRSPFNTSDIAQAAALAAFQDEDYMRSTVHHTIQDRERLLTTLQKFDWSVIPSQTNFCCILLKKDPKDFYRIMLHRGIIVRPLAPFGLPQGVRVTVGRTEEVDFFLETIQNLPELKGFIYE